MAASIVILLAGGCTKERGGNTPGSTDEWDSKVISLQAAIIDRSSITVPGGNDERVGAPTRASVDGFSNTPLAFGVRRKQGATTIISHWNAIATIYGQVFFTPQQSFDPDIESYEMRGYNPRSTQISGDGSVVTIDLTGQEDLMVSDEKNPGTYDVQVTNQVAYFEHKLAQLRFTVVNDPSNPFPVEKIKEIWVYATNDTDPLCDQALVNVVTGDVQLQASVSAPLGYWMCAYSASSGIGTENMADGIPISPGTQEDIAKVMFQPGKRISLYVSWGDSGTDKDYIGDLPISNPDNGSLVTQVGRSYLVTLRFGASLGLTVNSPSITTWQTGYTNGSSNPNFNVW